ncbi:hypothetical protein V2J09_005433 [Rumex salicifolius]
MDNIWRQVGVLILVVASFHVSLGGLLENGDFESPPNPSAMSGTKLHGTNSIPSWKTSGFVEFIKSGEKQGDMVLIVPQGEYAVRLGEDASISQRARLKKGTVYAITFSFARTCGQEEKLNLSVSDPNSVGPASSRSKTSTSSSSVLPLQTIYSSVGFDSFSWAFKAKANVVDIVLHNPARKEDDPTCGPIVDTIAINELRPPSPTRDNLVKNGNFEEGPYVFHTSTWGVLLPPNVEDEHSPLPGWVIESLKSIKYIDAPHFFIPSGKKAVELVAGRECTLSQTLRTIIGKTYVLSFSIGDSGTGCSGDLEVEAFAGRQSVRVVYSSKGKGGFKRAQLAFKADKARTRLSFLSRGYSMTTQGSLCGPVVDDVRVVSVRYPR